MTISNDLKVAVITPYKDEDISCIERCIATLQAQEYPAYLHLIVCDGNRFPIDKSKLPDNVQVIELPSGCEDTGASPRAIGSIYAIAQHCDGLAYLDIDNTVTTDHISNAVQQAVQGACIVIADRWICDYNTGEPLFRDNIENGFMKEDGVMFVDTNTLFLFGPAMIPGTQWWQVQRQPGLRTAGVDRIVWRRITQFSQNNQLKTAKTGKPTVYYRSRWKHHYKLANRPAPSPCKTLEKVINGLKVAKWIP